MHVLNIEDTGINQSVMAAMTMATACMKCTDHHHGRILVIAALLT